MTIIKQLYKNTLNIPLYNIIFKILNRKIGLGYNKFKYICSQNQQLRTNFVLTMFNKKVSYRQQIACQHSRGPCKKFAPYAEESCFRGSATSHPEGCNASHPKRTEFQHSPILGFLWVLLPRCQQIKQHAC